ATPVPAQPGQRDEHLARVGDDSRAPGRDEPGVPGAARVPEQPVQIGTAGVQQGGRLTLVKRLAVPGAGQGPPNRGNGRPVIGGPHRSRAANARIKAHPVTLRCAAGAAAVRPAPARVRPAPAWRAPPPSGVASGAPRASSRAAPALRWTVASQSIAISYNPIS